MAIRTIKTILKQKHLNYIQGVEPNEEEVKRESYARSYIETLITPLFEKVYEKAPGESILQITFYKDSNGATYLTCSSMHEEPIKVGFNFQILRDAVDYAEEYEIDASVDGECLDFELNLND